MLSSAFFSSLHKKRSPCKECASSDADHPSGHASRLIQRQHQSGWIPIIYYYVFPENAFQRTDQALFRDPHFSFPPSPNCRQPPHSETLQADHNYEELFDHVHAPTPDELTEILNSVILLPDDHPASLPPPPLHLDASKPVPELDLSNDYLQSLQSDYFDIPGFP